VLLVFCGVLFEGPRSGSISSAQDALHPSPVCYDNEKLSRTSLQGSLGRVPTWGSAVAVQSECFSKEVDQCGESPSPVCDTKILNLATCSSIEASCPIFKFRIFGRAHLLVHSKGLKWVVEGGPESGPGSKRHIISCSVGGCDLPAKNSSFQAPASPSFMKEIVKRSSYRRCVYSLLTVV